MTVLATSASAPTSCRDVTWTSARERAHAAPVPLPATRVPLADAAGFTLAGALRSPQPMPGFDTAAMDGYAVGPGVGPWRVRGVVRAGGVWTGGSLYAGEAVGISTGAPVPAGAHAVIPLERATRSGDLVHGPSAAEGRHIRRAGEDAPAGSVLAPAGTRIGPALLGLAAACGNDTLPVRPRPRVRVLVTGDELTRTGRPAPGRVRDALGPLLPPLIEASGGETADVRHVPDRPVGSLRALVGTGAYDGVDVTVVTGSTSVGVTDQLRLLLPEADAQWVVDSVACRPGHPQLLARLPGHWVVGLPGNPYGALVAAHTLLAPLLSGLLGRPLPALPRIPLTGDIRPVPGRTRLVPVAWDGTTARPVGGDRPAFLHGAALADALAAVAPDWRPGQPAPLILHH
ncbi:molybdopterin molybdenumtransferase MoeA [Streptomyces sp. SID2563]|uniref:molybdopterin molybdotransferase MoeA n=1 Tax=Streptomyces sp. SID2563 TaxID=2690255 RepID=UPI0013687896|nr:molybdopterin molybdotransferase MoeA [Streptomyces sp. SID2563]MYW13690.1 molybdopterin molybdenumtransferase MoeA [Streptomyces sp. SID2563]